MEKQPTDVDNSWSLVRLVELRPNDIDNISLQGGVFGPVVRWSPQHLSLLCSIGTTRDGGIGLAVYILCVVFGLLLAVACAIWCCRRSKADGDDSPAKRLSVSTVGSQAKSSPRSSNSLAGSFSMPRSSLIAAPSESGMSDTHPKPNGTQMPLCKLLIVPEGTRLACVVQNDVCRKKQDLSFNIRGMQSRGGAALFQIRVSEHGNVSPGIYVETLGGKDQLAFLSTEELWKGTVRPILSISRHAGEHYGSIQKNTNGEYIVQRGELDMWVLSGDFTSHSVQVMSMSNQLVASVCPGNLEEYQVYVQARIDAGLLILSMIAIDKCEADPGASSQR